MRSVIIVRLRSERNWVVQAGTSYQSLIDRARHIETLAALREGMDSAEGGELKLAAQVLAEMRAKYGLAR